MTITLYLLLALLTVYLTVACWHALGFVLTKNPEIDSDEDLQPFSIIICARNEEKKIGRCLQGIIQQDYDLSKIEIIVVNDASSDSTAFQAQSVLKDSNVPFRVITNKEHKGKKQSITYAMQFVKHDLIVVRDADTFTKSYSWLHALSSFYKQNKPDVIIGPLGISDNFGIFWALQAIETAVLSVFTAGAAYFGKPYLASGANMVFTKQIFERVNGFQRHINIRSGDDVLFVEDVRKVPGSKIMFLKSPEAIVSTYPCRRFTELFNQKVRWAAKFKVNGNLLNLGVAIITFLTNLAWIFCLFYGFLVPQNGGLSLIFVLLKLLIDNLLLFLASRFFKNKSLILYALPVGCIYPVYVTIVSLAAVFIKPKWK